jgi:hypothetical protein
MSGSDDDELSPEDLAGIEEYEKSEEGKAAGKTAPEGRAARLTRLFNDLPEMSELALMVDTLNARLDPTDTETVSLQVPKQFLAVLEFLERKNALDAGREPVAAAAVLSQIVTNELHETLHWLTVQPAHFSHYRNLWNRFCDDEGEPEEKIAAPKRAAEDGEDPF